MPLEEPVYTPGLTTLADLDIIPTNTAGIEENIIAGTVVSTIPKGEIPNPYIEYTLQGDDAALFEIVNYEIRLRQGAVIDFETNPVINLIVQARDVLVYNMIDDINIKSISLNTINLQEIPEITISPVAPRGISELVNAGVVVAHLSLGDITSGVTYSLSGEDAKLLEVVDNKIQIKAGAFIDFETNPVLDFTVEAVDTNLDSYAKDFSLNVLDVALDTATEFTDTLYGSLANDTIYGLGGADSIFGREGNDNLYGGELNDILYGGDGNDFLSGGNDYDFLYGNTGDDIVYGDAGDDRLTGDAGNDTLFGGLGLDQLSGGAGNDTFVFDTTLNARSNKDNISDFNHNDDTIALENSIFAKLTLEGVLSADSFKANSTGRATDRNDYILYNKTTGDLSYDSDGSGSKASVVFAHLDNKPLDLSFNDFMVI